MGHEIELARSARSRCRSCGRPIPKGVLRLSEEFVSEQKKEVATRFHHLECAADFQPNVLLQALETAEIDIPERAELDQRIERALTITDVAQEDEELADEYRVFAEKMIADPNDAEAMTVFSDWLQSVEDPRGELIAIQTEMESTPQNEQDRLVEQEKKLLATHKRRLMPQLTDAKFIWRRGFVRRVELRDVSSMIPAAIERMLKHPSSILVQALAVKLPLEVEVVVTPNLPELPETITTVELGDGPELMLGGVSALVKGLPRLQKLRLDGVGDLESLSHKQLHTLELRAEDARREEAHEPRADRRSLAQRLAGLTRKRLPKLETLIVDVDAGLDDLVDALLEGDLLKKLKTLKLTGDLSTDAARRLTKKIPKAMERVDVSGCPRLTEGAREGLERDVNAPEPEETGPIAGEGPVRYRHIKRPEWGVGTVVEEHDDKIDVEFEHAGLKSMRNSSFLEPVE